MRIPLHHGNDMPFMKRLRERYDLWLVMSQTNPKGFRSPPTSRKNPRTRSPHPQTPLEAMGKAIA